VHTWKKRTHPVDQSLSLITKNQLSYLADNGFKAVDMARMFQVSVATIHRRLKDFNMQIQSNSNSKIDDKALDDIVRDVKLQKFWLPSDYRLVDSLSLVDCLLVYLL